MAGMTLKVYKYKVRNLSSKLKIMRESNNTEKMYSDDVKFALMDIIAEANSILAYIRHKERKDNLKEGEDYYESRESK